LRTEVKIWSRVFYYCILARSFKFNVTGPHNA